MKFKIKENSITIDDVMEVLKEKFGNKYQVKLRQKGIIAVAKSKTCSANVFPLKNKLIINGGFPTVLGQMGFTVSVVALGVIPPLLVYFLVFNKKMKVMEKEVGEFLKEKYNDKIINN